MALNWLWSEHLGTVRRTDKRTGEVYYTDLYKGNTLLIEIYTNPLTDCYNLVTYWADEQHVKNCLADGLKTYSRADVILIERELKEQYKPAQAQRLIGYLLRSGANVCLV